jgi:hypothetical protein
MTIERTTESVDLDELLQQVREDVKTILQNPETAYERAVQRKLGSAVMSALPEGTGPVPSIEAAEKKLGVLETPSKFQYRMRSTGSFLLNWRRVITRKQLDTKVERIFAFKP